MNHSTPLVPFFQNISIGLMHGRKWLAVENLNMNLIIFQVETIMKIIDMLLGHHRLKGSSILGTNSLEVLIIMKFLPQTAQLGIILNYWETPVMLDAPVSGGVLAAEAGTLTFMVGGLEEAYLAAKSLFLSMGKSTIYCGGAGNGSAAKICNNLAMAVSMLGVSEAFSLGQSLGISAGTLTKIFNSSSGRCWSSDSYNPVPGVMEGVPSSRNYNGGFASKLMCTKFVFIQFIGHICLWCLQAKDLNIAFAAATEVGVKCPLASHAKKIFTELCNHGHGMEDFSCVFRHYYSGKEEP
ncbi:probable 3-hydroxyisobutyrate dehydrogenase, mitochondrial isoform X6 [Camellia sinensis]|uniref:probable 3-hydroxyisobutyrate dehydrogenase, mitochondrial isoform X6 n=1 Tax=Camellia sinensis TaxID=4442 RepID=UPI001035D2CB|nr:probable 3-hydroxyisobutyrate dehydrogenase, mitochondrial isoform X6 [Camellia sinensis]